MVHNEVVSGSQHINGQHLKKNKGAIESWPKLFSCPSELRYTEHEITTAHKN